MTISIIIPIYNKAQYLRRCLDSIKNQTYADLEVWMIDDGSTDGSGDICREYEEDDSRFHYVYQENSGWASSPRNTGLSLATGKWIGFPDPDDYCESTMYETLFKNSANADIVLCNMKAYDTRKNAYLNYYHEAGHYNRWNEKILSNNKYDIGFINRGLFRRSTIGDLRFMHTFCEDCIWETALLNKSKLGLTIIPDKLYHYFIYADSLVRTEMSKEFLLRAYKNIYEFVYRSDCFKDNTSLKFRLIHHLSKYLRRIKKFDLVFPIVNTSKQSFIDDYIKYAKLEGHYNPQEDAERFNYNDDMLKYMFRSIDKWMDFINVVHVIVRSDDDIPDWLDTSKVNIIYHSDYIPADFLPTFNAGTIECFLSNLLITENFIYANDDMVALAPLNDTDFFINGIPATQLERTDKEFFRRNTTCKSFFRMLRLAGFPSTELYKCRHIFSPFKLTRFKVSTAKHLKEIVTSITRFRNERNIAQWYFMYDQVLNFDVIYKAFPYSYIDKDSSIKSIKNRLNPRLYKASCINSMGENESMIMDTLKEMFKEKCWYER